jgi:hypothetical protein
VTNDEILLRLFEAIIKAAPHKSVEEIMHLWGEAAVFMGAAAYPSEGTASVSEGTPAHGVQWVDVPASEQAYIDEDGIAWGSRDAYVTSRIHRRAQEQMDAVRRECGADA